MQRRTVLLGLASSPILGAFAADAEPAPRLARLALFYDLKLAIVAGQLLQWRGNDRAQPIDLDNPMHVAVAARSGYAVDGDSQAWQWDAESRAPKRLLAGVRYLAAGETGLLAVRTDGSLWQHKSGWGDWKLVAPRAAQAWVGDSSDYYIDHSAQLWASGRAHRGQYGTGQLTDAPGWVSVARDALSVCAHTGHAVYLRRDGAVLGTGGNRFGPLGPHGLGDKAERWGVIFTGAEQVATGSRHTVALRADGTLWGWGGGDGTVPRRLMDHVSTMAAGDTETIALTRNGQIWQWKVGSQPMRLSVGA